MADQQEIGCRPGDDLAANFVGRGAHDGAPETGCEEDDEQDEQDNEEPARARAPARLRASGPVQ
jgi:hypothetical protein